MHVQRQLALGNQPPLQLVADIGGESRAVQVKVKRETFNVGDEGPLPGPTAGACTTFFMATRYASGSLPGAKPPEKSSVSRQTPPAVRT